MTRTETQRERTATSREALGATTVDSSFGEFDDFRMNNYMRQVQHNLAGNM